MCYKKRKITEYLNGLYVILRQKKYTKRTFYMFTKDWETSTYESGIASVCIDILYTILMQNQDRLNGLRDAVRVEYGGDIEAFLSGNEFIKGSVIKPKKGIAKLGWEFLEKLCENDMKYFDDIYQIMQEKNKEKNKENT
jgi:hypothetical protein